MASAPAASEHPFGRRSYDETSAIVRTETEIAVLHIQMTNIVEKVDELKEDIKSIKEEVKSSNGNTIQLIRDMENSNKQAHDKLSSKVSALEKWRWMLMGAGVAIGALGFPTLSKLLGMG